MQVPAALGWWGGRPGGAAWLELLPSIVARLAERWQLALEPAFPDGRVSLVLPARRHDGTRAVLKVSFPERETTHEPDALAFWAGDGAARLLAHAAEESALLVERLDPGTRLWDVADEDEANLIAAGVLRRLRRPAPADGPFRLLAQEATRWCEEIPRRWQRLGRPFERSLADRAVAALRELGAEAGEQVVLHQDLHGGNVLADGAGWRAIDPKPLVGDPAFDAASLLRDRRPELAGDPRAQARVRRRLDLLASELDTERERLRGWAVAHALAWGIDDDGYDEQMVGVARLLAAA